MEKHRTGTLLALQNAVAALLREASNPTNVRLALGELDEQTRALMGWKEDATGHSTDPELAGYAASMHVFWKELGGPS